MILKHMEKKLCYAIVEGFTITMYIMYTRHLSGSEGGVVVAPSLLVPLLVVGLAVHLVIQDGVLGDTQQLGAVTAPAPQQKNIVYSKILKCTTDLDINFKHG